jgi:hypothetical protein
MKPFMVSTVLHPRNVERFAVRVGAGLIKGDKRGQRLAQRRRRKRNGRLQVTDDASDLGVVKTANLVDLLHELAVAHGQPRVQLVLLAETLDVGHGHAVVEVVGARGENVAHRLIVRQLEVGAVTGGDRHRLGHARSVKVEQELAGGQVVVRPGVEPEQLGISGELRQRIGRNTFSMRQHTFQQVANAQVMTVPLVVVDVAPGNRRLVEVPDKGLLLERQLVKAIGIQLDDGGFADLFEQVRTGGRHEFVRGAVRPSGRGQESRRSTRVPSECEPSVPLERAARRARGR